MSPVGTQRFLICAARGTDLRQLFETQGYAVTTHPLDAPDPDSLNSYRLLLFDASGDQTSLALQLLLRLRPRLEDLGVPVLVCTDDSSPPHRLVCLEAGADACLFRPFLPGELFAQVAALLRVNTLHNRVGDKTAEIHRINKLLNQAYEQIEQQLAVAQRLQASFLPQSLPRVPNVRFAIHHLLSGRLGGDFYDVFRLDERHVGFYVADAMGHGVPASLLTLFVKKGVRGKEVLGSQYRLVQADDVLYRLNRDLLDQQLAGQPFLTMLYGLYNHDERTLQLARAGHPPPLHLPRDGEPSLWRQEGLMLGVMDARFPAVRKQLRPGDKLLFYTDGIDTARYNDHAPGTESLLACARQHRGLPIDDFVTRLARELFAGGSQPDDLTLFALETT